VSAFIVEDAETTRGAGRVRTTRRRRVARALALGLAVLAVVCVLCSDVPRRAVSTTGRSLLLFQGFESGSFTGYSPQSVVSLGSAPDVPAAAQGTYLVRVTSTSSTAVPIGVNVGSVTRGLTAGDTLQVSCSVRTGLPGYPVTLVVTETTPAGKTPSQRITQPTANSWSTESLRYVVSQTGSNVGLSVFTTGPTAGTSGLGVDACSIRRVPQDQVPAIPTAVPAGYTRAFTEDFNTTAPLGTFIAKYKDFGQYGGLATNKSTVYSSDKVLSASHGSAFFNLHSEHGTSYAAALLPANKLDFQYGQIGVCVRLDSSVGRGYKMAFLLWPKTNQWTNEVDFPETNPDFSANPYAASLITTARSTGPHNFVGSTPDPFPINFNDHRYHTFLLDWTPTKISATVDGTYTHTYTGNAVPAQLMHFVMQTEGWIGKGPVPAHSRAVLEVPWVYINTYN
jgi:hypothetical protein